MATNTEPFIVTRTQYDEDGYSHAQLDERGNLIGKLKDPSEAIKPEAEAVPVPMTEEERLERAAKLGQEARLDLTIEKIIRENED